MTDKARVRGAMTLRTLLLLFTGTLIVLLLSIAVTASFTVFRDYVVNKMSEHANDGATAVGLSLSHAIDGSDPVAAASLIDASFDSGHYQSIQYLDNEGDLVVGRSSNDEQGSVPVWFVRWIDLPRIAGEAEVVRGWTRLGRIEAVSSAREAYEDLWRAALFLALGTLVTALLAISVLGMLLARILRPLKALEEQASSFARRDFSRRSPGSSIRELNTLTESMNQSGDDLGQLFEGQSRLIHHLKKITNEDPLTVLNSRHGFDQRLRAEISDAEKQGVGVLLVIQMDGFIEVNHRFGREDADKILTRTGQLIHNFLESHVDAFAGRCGGTEFRVYLPGVSAADGELWSRELLAEISSIYTASAFPQEVAVYGGLVSTQAAEAGTNWLAAADDALRHARRTGPSGTVTSASAETLQLDADQWREIIQDCLDRGSVGLWCQPLRSFNREKRQLHQVYGRLRVKDEWIRGGDFVAIAERAGLMHRLDLLVIKETLAVLDADADREMIVTLGLSTVQDKSFVSRLFGMLASAGPAVQRLWLALPERAVAAETEAARQLIHSVRQLDVRVLVDRFGVGGVPFSYLRHLPVQALRIDASFVHGLEHQEDNRFFIESVTAIAQSCRLEVIAPGVEAASEELVLRELNVDMAMGYHFGRPEPL